MTLVRLATSGLRHYWRTHAAVASGVAAAVAVLAGSLLVGGSVRASLAALTDARLGRTDHVLTAESPFEEDLAARVGTAAGPALSAVAPLLAFEGVARHEASSRRAARVRVYGVDERFFSFHGVDVEPPADGEILLSPDLWREIAPADGDAIVLRVARPTDVPVDSLFGRKDDLGRSMRLRVRQPLDAQHLGEFSLGSDQGPVRAAFVALRRLQRDLGVRGRANVLLMAETSGSKDPDLQGASLQGPDLQGPVRAALTAADLGLKVEALPDQATVLVESSTGLLTDAVAGAVREIAARERVAATPVLTWLATSLTIAGRSVPYSVVTAIDPATVDDPVIRSALQGATLAASVSADPPLVLNDWAARELRARAGDTIDLEYFRWEDAGRLATQRATFVVAGIVPMRGLAADRRLAPEYPGITTQLTLGDWDPPFPIELARVRPVDDEYWREWRATPKAFLPLDVGQRLWRTRYGQVTSIRIGPLPTADLGPLAERLRAALPRAVSPIGAGVSLVAVRAQNQAASVGATDFGAYFSYFSFFLMVSGLLLTALFFRLNAEQRLPEVGLLRAVGYPITLVRRAFLLEAGVVAAAGAVLGVILAVAWAAGMMFGLRTWWVGAVGTSRLELHVDPLSLAIGAVGGALAALITTAVTMARLSKLSPRALLVGLRDAVVATTRRRGLVAALAAALAAAALTAAAFAGVMPAAAAFFGAGALVLVAGLALFRYRLGRPLAAWTSRGRAGLIRLGRQNAAWRPGRSLAGAGLVAAAVFLLVSVESFRKGSGGEGASVGTGGFALLAESALPFAHDPATPEGRLEIGLAQSSSDPALAGVTLLGARLRPGDDASCLNLYRPAQPRVLGVSEAWTRESRFRFARVIDEIDEAAGANPWSLLGDVDADGVAPAVVDQTSLQYVLHASVGDVITIDDATASPKRLRIVASLGDSVLQSEIIVSEAAFRRMFPEVEGYRMLFARLEAPADADAITRLIEERLDPFGVDVQDAARRLDAYHRVENTYLSTFQALGGLGLVLGSFGLAAVIARNVLERRRELALLGAAGYTGRDLQLVVLAEQLSIVGVGLAVGLVAAAVATAPVVAERGLGGAPAALLWVVVVAITGWLSAVGATRRVRRLPLVASLRSE